MITLFNRDTDSIIRPEPAQPEAFTQPINPGYEIVAAIKADAEAKCGALAQALEMAHQIEMELFSLLFSEARGLKHPFSEDVAKEAALARHALRARVLELSDKYGWPLEPKFFTDGEYNAAVEQGQYYTAKRRTVGITL